MQSKRIDFPSASAIEFYDNKLFVFGDDAPLMLVLSTEYELLDTIRLVPNVNGRISKDEKPDIESATIVMKNGAPVLFGVGSMSGEKRWTVTAYNLQKRSAEATTLFPVNTIFQGINEINIEGSCTINNNIVYANRANLSNPTNHLIISKTDKSVDIKRLLLPASKTVAGVSGLYCVREKDLLFFTASEEETGSSYEDGQIGESHLGWIENFSSKLNASTEFKPDGYIKLTTVSKVFTKQKIESVCTEKVSGDELLLHLVADNDKGDSHLFQLKVKW